MTRRGRFIAPLRRKVSTIDAMRRSASGARRWRICLESDSLFADLHFKVPTRQVHRDERLADILERRQILDEVLELDAVRLVHAEADQSSPQAGSVKSVENRTLSNLLLLRRLRLLKRNGE